MTEKKFTTSDQLVRKPFDLPVPLSDLLRAVGVEHRRPEDIGGLLFVCLAHLSVAVAEQFPEHWPIFRAAFVEACDDLRDVLTSDDPRKTMDGIQAKQLRNYRTLKSQQAADATTPTD